MTNNRLMLNANKTDFIIISTFRQRSKLTRFFPTNILSHSITPSDSVRNTLHLIAILISENIFLCFYHIRDLRHSKWANTIPFDHLARRLWLQRIMSSQQSGNPTDNTKWPPRRLGLPNLHTGHSEWRAHSLQKSFSLGYQHYCISSSVHLKNQATFPWQLLLFSRATLYCCVVLNWSAHSSSIMYRAQWFWWASLSRKI